MVFARQVPDDAGLQAARIERWATAAVNEAEVKPLDEEGYFAMVSGARGAWACEPTADEAVAVLKEVLVDWATLKVADGDDDIPSFGGISLGIR